ncbi:MAG: hypothetical protein QMD82_05945 [bacterium]|nr:hypothetical protein [bacterium]
MVSFILFSLLSWYSFFKVSPSLGNYKEGLFFNGNPAQFRNIKKLVAVSGGLWDEYSKIVDLSSIWNGIGFNFVFYNFGDFRYSGFVPDDETNLRYSAFAYKIGFGYSIAFDRNLYFGILPQYQRFEYYNQYAEGFTMNIGILHLIRGLRLYYEIFLRDFGLSSSEGYNFPGTFNAVIGFSPRQYIVLNYLYTKEISNGIGDFIAKGVVHRLGAAYSYKDLLNPSIALYLGDELRLFNIGLKFKFLKNAFVYYNFTFRKSGFSPIHNFTVGAE